MEHGHSWEDDSHSVKKFLECYGTQKFIAVFTKADLTASQMNPVDSVCQYFF
jgi:hypothetical protein